MRFVKFLAVMAAEMATLETVRALDDRLHRQLRESRAARDRDIQQSEPCGIDEILRIVENDHRETFAHAPFVGAQRTIEAVEAIGLGLGPVAIMDHDPQPVVSRRRVHRGSYRLGIVAIAADIDAQIRLRPGREHVRERFTDDGGFGPGRDENRRAAAQPARAQFIAIETRSLCPAVQPEPQPDQIDRDVVDRPDQEKSPPRKAAIRAGALPAPARNPAL